MDVLVCLSKKDPEFLLVAQYDSARDHHSRISHPLLSAGQVSAPALFSLFQRSVARTDLSPFPPIPDDVSRRMFLRAPHVRNEAMVGQ